MQIIIKGIKGSTADKNGQPYLDNQSRAKTRVTIVTDGLPNGKKEMSTFAYQDSPVMKWAMGETHEVDISVTPDGKYVNFFPANNAVARPAQMQNSAPQGSSNFPASAVPNNLPSGFTAEDRRMLTVIYELIAAKAMEDIDKGIPF